MKEYLVTSPILTFPNFDKQFILFTDASISGLEAILSHTLQENKYIVITIEYLTKWSEVHVFSNAKVTSVVFFFYGDIICHYRYPKVFLTDQGTHIINKLVDSLYSHMEV